MRGWMWFMVDGSLFMGKHIRHHWSGSWLMVDGSWFMGKIQETSWFEG